MVNNLSLNDVIRNNPLWVYLHITNLAIKQWRFGRNRSTTDTHIEHRISTNSPQLLGWDVYKNLAYEAGVTVMLVDSLYHGKEMSQSLIDSWDLDYECVYDTQSYDNGKIVVPAFLLEPVEITSDNMVQELVDNYGTYVLSEDGSLQVAE